MKNDAKRKAPTPHESERGEMARLGRLGDAGFRDETIRKYGFDPLAAKRVKIGRYDGTEKLIAKYRNGEKIELLEILRELAIAKRAGDGEEWVLIRTELLDIAGTKIVGKRRWGQAQSKAQTGQRRALAAHKRLQSRADEYWRKNPSLTAKRVAQFIAREMGGNPDWIRRVIRKPK